LAGHTLKGLARPLAPTEARRRWAELLGQTFEVDPLACPRCRGTMRINIEEIGNADRAESGSPAPPMRVKDFNFASLSDAV